MAEKEEIVGNIINGPSKWDLLIGGLAEKRYLTFEANIPLTQKIKVKIRGVLSSDPTPDNSSWFVMGELTKDQPENQNEHNFQFPTYFWARYSTRDRKGVVHIKEPNLFVEGNLPFEFEALLKDF